MFGDMPEILISGKSKEQKAGHIKTACLTLSALRHGIREKTIIEEVTVLLLPRMEII